MEKFIDEISVFSYIESHCYVQEEKSPFSVYHFIHITLFKTDNI